MRYLLRAPVQEVTITETLTMLKTGCARKAWEYEDDHETCTREIVEKRRKPNGKEIES